MIIEALLLIAALFLVAGIIGIVHNRRKKAKKAAEHAELMERLEAANRKERERRKTLRMTMPAPYGSAPRVTETRAHQNRYSDRRVADDDTDMMAAMMIQNAISQANTPVYVSSTPEYDNSSISSSTSYGYSSPSSETCSRSSYESSSSSSYDSSSSYSSSDSGSSSSCD
jgi:hypothetical protein